MTLLDDLKKNEKLLFVTMYEHDTVDREVMEVFIH